MNKATTELIETLALKLGITAEHMMTFFIKSAIINSMSILCLNVVTIFLCVITCKAYNRLDKEYQIRSEERLKVLIIITCFSMLLSLLYLSTMLNGFFNPEAEAIKAIMELISN